MITPPPSKEDVERGEIIRPPRFLPVVDWPHIHSSLAFGPYDIQSFTGVPDMTRGNYIAGWVAYVEEGGGAYLQKKLPNGVWDGIPRYLLALLGSIKKIGLEFAPTGYILLVYLRPDGSMGVWRRSKTTGLPQLVELDTDVQDVLIAVENKDDPLNTDVFIWYFKAGELYMRNFKDDFETAHGPYAGGLSNPVIIQAGINHRYGYQVDFRDDTEQEQP